MRNNRYLLVVISLLCLSGVFRLNADAQTTATTIGVYSNAFGSQARLLHSDLNTGSSLNLSARAFLDGAADAYIPFSLSSASISSIQSAATIQLQVSINAAGVAPVPTFSLYGYPNRKDNLSAEGGDYSGGTLLTTVSLPTGSTSGTLAIDVTKFAIQQADGGNAALSFRLQANPQTILQASPKKNELSNLAPFRSMLAAPQLVINHNVADSTSINNKVLVGYQGWFRTPNDAPGNGGWAHWFNADPVLTQEAFDSWPDMSQYSTAEQSIVPGFTFPNGSPATLYTAQNPRTVLRHFQWMENQGIDGIMLSEFGGYLPGGPAAGGPGGYAGLQTVLDNVRAAAAQTGRTWAVEYDISGMDPSTMYTILTNQWQFMVANGYTSDPHYLHQGGLPVVQIFGFFPKDSGHAIGDPNVGNPIIDFFQTGSNHAYLVGSGTWNIDPQDTLDNPPGFIPMLQRLNAYVPWNVGNVFTHSGIVSAAVHTWSTDQTFLGASGIKFIPLLYPGYSFASQSPTTTPFSSTPFAPRRDGNFLWEQYAAASAIPGINTVYIAMFDEANEGTQIMPITATPPVQTPAFYTYDSLPTDWYERLVVQGETMLRNGTPITTTIPIQP